MESLFGADFDVNWSLSPPGAAVKSTPRYHGAPASSADADRQATSVLVARTHSPWNRTTSPTADRYKPLSVDTYSSEVTASVQPGPGSGSVGRESPRPLVFDIEVGRRLPPQYDDDDDDVRPLQRLSATMPRPDTPSNVWYAAQTPSVILVKESELPLSFNIRLISRLRVRKCSLSSRLEVLETWVLVSIRLEAQFSESRCLSWKAPYHVWQRERLYCLENGKSCVKCSCLCSKYLTANKPLNSAIDGLPYM